MNMLLLMVLKKNHHFQVILCNVMQGSRALEESEWWMQCFISLSVNVVLGNGSNGRGGDFQGVVHGVYICDGSCLWMTVSFCIK